MHQTSTDKKALIVGCGIVGPVLAMFLQRAGIDAVVYEGRPEPDDEAGYFLNLAPNGVAVLDTLDIKDEVIGHGAPTTSIVFLNHRGKQLDVLPETTILLKRGLLNKALREAAIRSGVPVEFGKRLKNVQVTRSTRPSPASRTALRQKATSWWAAMASTRGPVARSCRTPHGPSTRA